MYGYCFKFKFLLLFLRVTDCHENTYGHGCSMVCGLCVNGEQCNYVNGTCHNGCEAGIYGRKCKMGISLALKGNIQKKKGKQKKITVIVIHINVLF